MKCAICGITVETIDEAIEGGWTPYFYDADKELEPACPSCSEALLHMGEDGEMEVRAEYRGKLIYLHEKPKEHSIVGVMLTGGMFATSINENRQWKRIGDSAT